jgi:hypothetical protein
MPILESMWCLEKQPWHDRVSNPNFNFILIGSRRSEFEINHYHIFQHELLDRFCTLMRMVASEPDLKVKQQPVFLTFAHKASAQMIAAIEYTLSLSRGAIQLMYCLQADDLFDNLAKALNETYPEIAMEMQAKMDAIRLHYNMTTEGFFTIPLENLLDE